MSADESEGTWRPLDGTCRVGRFASTVGQQAAEYAVRAGIRTGARLVRAGATSQSLAELVGETQDVAIDELERLGVDVDYRDGDDGGPPPAVNAGELPRTEADLREYGARLLEESADVDYEERVHPTYPRILMQLAPDEARILRLLATDGPQPSVDIRDAGYLPISSKVVAAGLTMIGDQAGCNYTARTSMYLSNLERLGLVWFADEPVEDLKSYQVMEAQPGVVRARKEARRPKIVRRSIHLTPLGVDFCDVCMPFEVTSENAAGPYDHHVDPAE